MFTKLLTLLTQAIASETPLRSRTNGATKKKQKPRPLHLGMETMERREVMAAGVSVTVVAPVVPKTTAALVGTPKAGQTNNLAGNALITPTAAATSQSVASAMVAFLESKIGTRLGGGECAHMATEALRVSGGKFQQFPADNPNPGDYVWGTFQKSMIFQGGKVVDSSPTTALRPGDIIQYSNATFSTGMIATHHTAVVASVDAQGRVTAVYEQNMQISGQKGGDRTVAKHALDLSKLNGGAVRIYRPMVNTPVANQFQFSIVNNTATSQTVSQMIGSTSIGSISLTSVKTANSYKTGFMTVSGATPSFRFNGVSYAITNGAGYEIYTNAQGVAAIRKI